MRIYPLDYVKEKIRSKSILLWTCRMAAAVILLQTLYFKFTAHPDSVLLFSTLGIEPYGRILIGVIELIASFLLIYPATTIYGALIGAVLMLGAVFSHLTKLGVVFQGDAWLFIYAVIVLICCSILIVVHKNQILLQAKMLMYFLTNVYFRKN